MRIYRKNWFFKKGNYFEQISDFCENNLEIKSNLQDLISTMNCVVSNLKNILLLNFEEILEKDKINEINILFKNFLKAFGVIVSKEVEIIKIMIGEKKLIKNKTLNSIIETNFLIYNEIGNFEKNIFFKNSKFLNKFFSILIILKKIDKIKSKNPNIKIKNSLNSLKKTFFNITDQYSLKIQKLKQTKMDVKKKLDLELKINSDLKFKYDELNTTIINTNTEEDLKTLDVLEESLMLLENDINCQKCDLLKKNFENIESENKNLIKLNGGYLENLKFMKDKIFEMEEKNFTIVENYKAQIVMLSDQIINLLNNKQ